MITSAQLRAARAMLGIDQRTLAERAGVSLPTIQPNFQFNTLVAQNVLLALGDLRRMPRPLG